MVLSKCRASESSQLEHYAVKAGLVGLVGSEITVLHLIRAWISLEDKVKQRPCDPVLAGLLAQILKSVCILGNYPMTKKGFKPSA